MRTIGQSPGTASPGGVNDGASGHVHSIEELDNEFASVACVLVGVETVLVQAIERWKRRESSPPAGPHPPI